jgi:hypothetical protein
VGNKTVYAAKRIWEYIETATALFLPLSCYIAALVYAVNIWIDPGQLVSGITYSAVVISGALAALCFSLANVADFDDAFDRRMAIYAGERYLLATMMFIAAAILRYALVATYNYWADVSGYVTYDVVTTLFEFICLVVFVSASVSAYVGTFSILNLLRKRRAAPEKQIPPRP